MARYKPQDHKSLLLPVVLSEQIVPGSFAFALNYLVDNELDLSALDARFKNDEVGASAYDPRVMLKIVLLAYSQGLISSRVIAHAVGDVGYTAQCFCHGLTVHAAGAVHHQRQALGGDGGVGFGGCIQGLDADQDFKGTTFGRDTGFDG